MSKQKSKNRCRRRGRRKEGVSNPEDSRTVFLEAHSHVQVNMSADLTVTPSHEKNRGLAKDTPLPQQIGTDAANVFRAAAINHTERLAGVHIFDPLGPMGKNMQEESKAEDSAKIEDAQEVSDVGRAHDDGSVHRHITVSDSAKGKDSIVVEAETARVSIAALDASAEVPKASE